mmetsp:Transcript_17144/g.35880  ORF Transcript_17144/g.35880 Transcript_17144/m.35880 type:complete len:479 (+) Transcript_17144:137-1573(+)
MMMSTPAVLKLLTLASLAPRSCSFNPSSLSQIRSTTSTLLSNQQRPPTPLVLFSSYDYEYDFDYESSQATSSSSSPYGAIDVSENAPRDISSMEEWVSSNGALRQGFYLHSSDDYHTDVHAVASQPLPCGTTVLYVPEAMILTSAKAMAELRSNQMNQAEKIIQSVNAQDQLRHFYLMLKVLVEYEKGQDSPWYHWLNSLPRYYTNAASMTPFCYECLPSLMKKLAMEERRLLGKLSVRSVPFLSDDTVWNEELCTWAFQVVYTRSFESPDGDLKLVPLGDYFNHGSDYTEIATCYDDDGNYYATTTYDVEAGCPLRMSYGDPTNPSFLFARYGFVDESSLATFCKIFPPHVNADMEALGYAQNKMLFYKDTGDISQEVWDILLYQVLSSTKIGDRRALMKAHLEEDYATKHELHQQYYPMTSALLLNHIDTFIEQLDKLSQLAEGKDWSEHPRLPLILKHNQFVRNTFMRVRERFFG